MSSSCSKPERVSASGSPLMAIIVDNDTKLVVQGATGREGSFHTLRNRDYGTDVVAGVTPGKGGQDLDGIPIFDTVAEAVAETPANTSMVFVPARFAADAIYEDRKSTRLNSSHGYISYAVFCLKKKKKKNCQFIVTKNKKKTK